MIRPSIMKLSILILLFTPTIYSLELKKLSTCQTALGMQSGSIPDSAISASSSYDPATVGPKASRARTEQYGGAWCPLNQVVSTADQWLEIDFGNITYLTQVETQGRFDNGRGKEYADYYLLMYTRTNATSLEETSWVQYKPKNGDNNSSWIRANQNTHMGVIRQLDPPIVAKRLRFYPVSQQPRTICMRVEVYGCLFSDGIVSYSMPQGRTDVNSFGDETYDGKYVPSSQMLTDGLGQLSDGVTGTEDISIIDGRQPWIGWSNDSHRYISISFRFDCIRQINRMTIHASNLFSKDIFIFKSAIISFSTGKDEPNYSNSVIYQHPRDEMFEIARPILIELNNHLADTVRLDLYFDSKWMLISEITFDSQVFNERMEKKADLKEKITRKAMNVAADPRKRNRELPSVVSTTTMSTMLTVELSLAFVIGASLAIGLLLVGSLVWILRQKKKLQFQKLTEKPCPKPSCYAYPTLPVREFYDFNAPISSALDDREYAAPEMNFYSTFSPKHPFHSPHSLRASNTNTTSINSYPTLKSIPPCCHHQSTEQYMAMQDEAAAIEAMCGNSLIVQSSAILNDQPLSSIKEFNRDDVLLLDKLGDGIFGSIHLAEMNVMHPSAVGEIVKQTVIVKSLHDHVTDQQKAAFRKEIELLAPLSGTYVCSLLGTLNEQRTVAVFEYYSLDLYQYLRQQSIPMDNTTASSFLLLLACQIASAMKYLSALQLIHRDLAARNCLISSDTHQIRLTDIAIAKSEYSNDYARVGRRQSRIAIRWAAWESIFLNQFSLKSDVWSFAVTLYELYTYARQRPYHMLTNEQYVQHLASCTQMQSSTCPTINAHHLPQPELCSKEIYDMMCECWQRDTQHRPSFADIHTFLMGKASGSISSIPIGLQI